MPVFFVLMGLRTDLRSFLRDDVPALASALTAAPIVSKLACSRDAGKRLDRLSVGIGMTPRGEMGPIFANIGLGLSVGGERIIDEPTYSALVVMVIVTMLVTPPALKWSLARAAKP